MCIYVLALCHTNTDTDEDVLAAVFSNGRCIRIVVDDILESIKF